MAKHTKQQLTVNSVAYGRAQDISRLLIISPHNAIEQPPEQYLRAEEAGLETQQRPLGRPLFHTIDWNKVAHDPILSQEITNGHAAHIRYSRFKKQMEGTVPVRRPHNNNSPGHSSTPKKSKVEKSATKSPHTIKERTLSEDVGEREKLEAEESGYGIGDDIPEVASHRTQNPRINIKREDSPRLAAVASQNRDNDERSYCAQMYSSDDEA
ncbi:hypothetical protein OIDMADRAFT_33719 [Oidiodendron maius Zn]|uniref:Myb-like DNA-binding domain-containing protein n=1 Tax=Oidiodendron maius (strain Zn) TaxID=913774 RepID=A0A0C3GWM5_OIDMZ|nr:hypothetical protein OIDMADRAFT_33719 [Oidiodendron maius Zn]